MNGKADRVCGRFQANVEDQPCQVCGWGRKFHLNRGVVEVAEPDGPVPGTGTSYGYSEPETKLEIPVEVHGEGTVVNPVDLTEVSEGEPDSEPEELE